MITAHRAFSSLPCGRAQGRQAQASPVACTRKGQSSPKNGKVISESSSTTVERSASRTTNAVLTNGPPLAWETVSAKAYE